MRILCILLFIAFLLAACLSPAPTATPTASPSAPSPTSTKVLQPEVTATPVEEPIYLSIIWHQHQPVYFKDPQTGDYARPWVRVHATKDYVDMAAMIQQYPDIHATFNLTPSLIRQLDDLAGGAKDIYWTLSEIPSEQLSDDQKQFILDRFFDTNRKIIDRFPRYRELLDKRDGSTDPLTAYTTQDFLDLQMLFNLAWVDPDWLADQPLAELVAKGENFEEVDKEILFAEHLRLIQEVIPLHRQLQNAGQIEITMTPFAHPILPLLVTTDLAREALPDLDLPGERFVYGQDAVAQVELGVQLYEEHFGRAPLGMWPAEGSVAQEIVTMVAKNGIRWMASDEGVLANSLGFEGFTRDADGTVVEAEALYHPYLVQGRNGDPVAMIFRDITISDKVGFTYSGMEGKAAATDFVQRIHAIRETLTTSGEKGPHLVSVILDGENAWEYYDNDGKEFLHSLYQQISEDPLIETVTPSEFLEIAPNQPLIDDLWAGSWINHDFATWIGEKEENTAWELLAATRKHLQSYITGSRKGQTSEPALSEALLQMYIAEGSDWFWWYGADQNSGNDYSFDQQFRDTLKQVYLILGDEPPDILDIPVIPEQSVRADQGAKGLITPVIDGELAEEEWADAGLYLVSSGVMAAAQPAFESLLYGFDSQNLYLGIKLAKDFTFPAGESNLEVYLDIPGTGTNNNFSQAGNLLGFPAGKMLVVHLAGSQVEYADLYEAAGDEIWVLETPVEQISLGKEQLEMGIPLASLSNTDSGDQLTMRVFYNQMMGTGEDTTLIDLDHIPKSGPAVILVPDLGNMTVVIDIADPEGDDYGPGSYTYPQDTVFTEGNFDILNFQIGFNSENIVFKFSMRGPVDNPWDSSNGLSLQTFDIYIDKDGDGQGGVAMLPGRNLSLEDGYTWDVAITIEGWTSGIYSSGAEGPQLLASESEFSVFTDPDQRQVTIRVPKEILGDDPQTWRYAAVALSQEGFPSGGVMRVRDVFPEAEQWRIGGAPEGAANHTRVMDLVWPVAGEQEIWLSTFTPSQDTQTKLSSADFARVPMIEH